MKYYITKILILVFAILLVLTALTPSAKAEVFVFGIPAKTYTKSPAKAAVGGIVSILVHEVSHIIALKATGTPYKWNTTTFRYDASSKKNDLIVAHAGFVGQTLVSSILRNGPMTSFKAGFIGMSGAEILSYPLRRSGGDLGTLKKYGHDTSKAIGIYNSIISSEVLRITW